MLTTRIKKGYKSKNEWNIRVVNANLYNSHHLYYKL